MSLFNLARKGLWNLKTALYGESRFEILTCKLGIPSKCMSSTCIEYVPALCTHRPSLLPIERFSEVLGLFGSRITLTAWREDDQTVAFRGSKSRNKVSVGEPAEGSLSVASLH